MVGPGMFLVPSIVPPRLYPRNVLTLPASVFWGKGPSGGGIPMERIVGIILSFSVFAAVPYARAGDTSPAAFKDPALAADIKSFVHGADPAKPLTKEQLDHVLLVSASNKPIQDLSGLEKCANLNTVYLSKSEVSELG